MHLSTISTLLVTVGGNTYKGNVFSGPNSATGGIADTRNNVESVVIPAGITGSFNVRVMATNIAGDGVPHDNDPLDQTSRSPFTTPLRFQSGAQCRRNRGDRGEFVTPPTTPLTQRDCHRQL